MRVEGMGAKAMCRGGKGLIKPSTPYDQAHNRRAREWGRRRMWGEGEGGDTGLRPCLVFFLFLTFHHIISHQKLSYTHKFLTFFKN